MLYSYAGRNKEDSPFSRYGNEKGGVPPSVGEEEEYDESAVEVTMEDMTLAQEMNFEVVNPDDSMTVRTKEVSTAFEYCHLSLLTALSLSFSLSLSLSLSLSFSLSLSLCSMLIH